jgi:membrane metallo-endopeptidase-like protein 1
MESMDETADPCQDFYQFACGGWKKRNVIPRGSDKISQIGILDDRIQHFIQGITTTLYKPFHNSTLRSRTLFAEFFKENSTRVESKPVNNTRDMYRACLDTGKLKFFKNFITLN